jgi:DNA-binding response OmpR family regulator
MAGNGQVVTHARLIRKAWGDEHDLKDTVVLWQTVTRLRKKLSEISPKTTEYIEIEHGVGYRFSA